MNRNERRKAVKQGANDAIVTMEKDLRFYKEQMSRDTQKIQQLQDELQETRDKLADGQVLIAKLTKQIEDSGRQYMWTLGAIAKSNGGEIRIPGSAIDSIQEDDIIENNLDELRDEIVFSIRPKGTDSPSGIILPGRAVR